MMEDAKRQVELEPETGIIKVIPGPDCPSPKTAWVSTAAFAGSTVFYMISTNNTNDKWAEYAQNWESGSPYDTYKNASRIRKIAAGLSIGTGIFTAYQWWRYFKAKKNCGKNSGEIGSENGLKINVFASHIRLSYHF